MTENTTMNVVEEVIEETAVNEVVSGKGKGLVALGLTLLVAGAAWGAKKLYDNHKAKKEQDIETEEENEFEDEDVDSEDNDEE